MQSLTMTDRSTSRPRRVTHERPAPAASTPQDCGARLSRTDRRQEASRRDRQEDGFVGRARGPPVTLYLDTSSAITLFVLEAGSEAVHACG